MQINIIFHSSSDTVFPGWAEGVCPAHCLLSVTPAAVLTITTSSLPYCSSSPIPRAHLPNLLNQSEAATSWICVNRGWGGWDKWRWRTKPTPHLKSHVASTILSCHHSHTEPSLEVGHTDSGSTIQGLRDRICKLLLCPVRRIHMCTGVNGGLTPEDRYCHCSNFPKREIHFFSFFPFFFFNLKTGRHLHGYSSLSVSYLQPFDAKPFKHWKHLWSFLLTFAPAPHNQGWFVHGRADTFVSALQNTKIAASPELTCQQTQAKLSLFFSVVPDNRFWARAQMDMIHLIMTDKVWGSQL